MADAGAAMVPTLAVMHVLASRYGDWGVPAETVPRLESVVESMSRSILIAREHGVLLGSGTDLLGPQQRDKGLEITLRADVENPMAAIVSATRDSAAVLRQQENLGTIECGKLADVIAVDFDPLTETKLFAEPDRVRVVIKGGKVCKDTRS